MNTTNCIEEKITLEETGQLLKYSLSNDLNDIKNAIYERTGYSINLDDVIPKLNPYLSVSVKQLMNKYNANFSMTTSRKDNAICVWINRRVVDEWFTVIIKEKNNSLCVIDC
ncbi:MAG: hypothetical protein FWD87_08110 [Spirochaetaceae bacterium]|nr:hypothetical protein [Spirochaetaceae bacterium]